MVVDSEKNQFQTNKIILRDKTIHLGKFSYPLTKEFKLPRLAQEGFIDIFWIAQKLEEIKNKKSIKQVNFVIEEGIQGMFIEFSPDDKNNIDTVNIFVDYAFLSLIDETDALIFCCHELGHLLDAPNLIKQQTFFNHWNDLFKIPGILSVLFLHYKYFQSEELWMQGLLFLGSVFLIFGSIALIKESLRAYLSRRNEYVADIFAVKLFGNLDSVINAFSFLNQMEEIPHQSNWFSSHPTINQRIKALKRRFWYKILLKSLWR